MPKLKLHLDADTSNKTVYTMLVSHGHDITRTPNEWLPADADDETQLLRAAAHGRCIFTFNIRDFVVLARKFPDHRGILLAHQSDWTLSSLIATLDRVLSETSADDWVGQTRWLNEWRV